MIRYPNIAGTFYPDQAPLLHKQIEELLRQAHKQPTNKDHKKQYLKALILPHAGYEFSGLTAAIGYDNVRNNPIDTIILIGPYHNAHFSGVSVWPSGTWVTPLGTIPIDKEMAKAIQLDNPHFQAPLSFHNQEHSLEVHVPFIQTLFPKAKLLPLLINDPQYAKDLAETLAKFVDKKNILVIASTDMSHYHPKDIAQKLDFHTLRTFESAYKTHDFSPLYDGIQKNEIQLCGAAAVLTVMELSKLLHWGDLKIFTYHHSGETTGDNESVVGYGASGIYEQNEKKEMLRKDQQKYLLQLARKTLFDYLSTKKAPVISVDNPLFQIPKAVFVTLRDQAGNLRGCIGQFTPEEPLYKAVQHMAIEAATKDSRFSPLTIEELPQLIIEISILSPIQKVKSVNDIVFGKHGVIFSQNNHQGVFLPEVAKSFSNKADFLSELCSQKAGLDRRCWQDPHTNIAIFTTEEFSEK